MLATECGLNVCDVEGCSVSWTEQDAGAVGLDLDDVVDPVPGQQSLDILGLGQGSRDVDAGQLVIAQRLWVYASHSAVWSPRSGTPAAIIPTEHRIHQPTMSQ